MLRHLKCHLGRRGKTLEEEVAGILGREEGQEHIGTFMEEEEAAMVKGRDIISIKACYCALYI